MGRLSISTRSALGYYDNDASKRLDAEFKKWGPGVLAAFQGLSAADQSDINDCTRKINEAVRSLGKYTSDEARKIRDEMMGDDGDYMWSKIMLKRHDNDPDAAYNKFENNLRDLVRDFS